MGFAFFAVLSISLCLLIQCSTALKCWHNSNSSDTAEWSIVECDGTNGECACLAQYRSFNGKAIPSYFGCHTPNKTCDWNCTAKEGEDNDFSCCCSGDLCNNILTTIPSPVNRTAHCCATKNCSHKCIEHNGVAECYCNPGYSLNSDGVTCSDLNECAHNNGGCEVNCHNKLGTGYYCSCGPRQIPRGKYHCEDYDGLVCWKQICTNNGCSPKVKQYCSGENPICQATYSHSPENGFQLRLLTCFNYQSVQETESCSLALASTSSTSRRFYVCYCDGNMCNGNIVFPEPS